jgi:hypothetical protein
MSYFSSGISFVLYPHFKEEPSGTVPMLFFDVEINKNQMSRFGAKNRFQEPSLELSSQAS